MKASFSILPPPSASVPNIYSAITPYMGLKQSKCPTSDLNLTSPCLLL